MLKLNADKAGSEGWHLLSGKLIHRSEEEQFCLQQATSIHTYGCRASISPAAFHHPLSTSLPTPHNWLDPCSYSPMCWWCKPQTFFPCQEDCGGAEQAPRVIRRCPRERVVPLSAVSKAPRASQAGAAGSSRSSVPCRKH